MTAATDPALSMWLGSMPRCPRGPGGENFAAGAGRLSVLCPGRLDTLALMAFPDSDPERVVLPVPQRAPVRAPLPLPAPTPVAPTPHREPVPAGAGRRWPELNLDL